MTDLFTWQPGAADTPAEASAPASADHGHTPALAWCKTPAACVGRKAAVCALWRKCLAPPVMTGLFTPR